MKTKSLNNIGLFICLIYILLRPFLNTYVTEYIKYIFILVMVYYAIKGSTNKKILKEIGYVEIFLYVLFMLYALLSSILVGGSELLVYSMERYVFYTIPLFVIPVIQHKLKWDNILIFLSWYGVVDSIISIIEFVIHRQLIPLEGVTHSVVQQFGDNSIRTFGLNGDYFLLAELLCLCAFSSLYLFIRWYKKIDLLKFVLISFGIFTTGSRGYYVAYSVGLAIFYILFNLNAGKPSQFIVKMGFAVSIIIMFLIFLFMTNIKTSISSIDTILDRTRSILDFSDNYANVERQQHWLYSINKWKTHPILGNGASITDMRYSGFEKVTESGFLKRLVELGIVGTILQYLTMIVPLIKGYKLFRGKKDFVNLMYIFFFSLIVTLATEDMVLQRYGEAEFTVVMWTSLAFISTYKKSRNVNPYTFNENT